MTFRVLVMDEDPKWQERLRNALETVLGYEVTVAPSYEDARRELMEAQTPFDLVTIDIEIPISSSVEHGTWASRTMGLQLLRHIANNPRGELCVVLSGADLTVNYFEELRAYDSILLGALDKEKSFGDFTTLIQEQLPARKKRIFVSYRRSDSQAITGRICEDHLAPFFGDHNIFYDQKTLPPGVDFRTYILDFIKNCDAVLVIIGPDWASIREDGAAEPRLFDPDDTVRVEVSQALSNNVTVIPLLVMNAEMPTKEQLPAELRELVYRNALRIRSDASFRSDIEHLLDELKKLKPRPRE